MVKRVKSRRWVEASEAQDEDKVERDWLPWVLFIATIIVLLCAFTVTVLVLDTTKSSIKPEDAQVEKH